MKKALYLGISLFSGIVNPHYEIDETTSPDIPQSELDMVLNEIFSVDEKSGLPKGDIQYYLSSQGNPQIKAWLENNLLRPRAERFNSSIEDVTDDMIAEMSRSKDESFEDYVSRLASIRDEVLENKTD